MAPSMNPLFALRDSLREQRMATAGQLATRLNLSTPVVQDMLGHWIRRGCVELVRVADGGCGSGGCAGCRQCGSSAVSEIYRWCDQPVAQSKVIECQALLR